MGRTLSNRELDFFEFDDEAIKREEIEEQFQWRSDGELEEGPDEISAAETKAFWDSQHQLLQVISFSSSSFFFLLLLNVFVLME